MKNRHHYGTLSDTQMEHLSIRSRFSEKFVFPDTSGKSAIEFVGLKLTPFIALVIEDKKRIWTEIGALLCEAGEDLKGVIRFVL